MSHCFEENLKNYTELIEDCCKHNDQKFCIYFERESNWNTDFVWHKKKCCKDCCDRELETAICKKYDTNFRLYDENDVDISYRYPMLSQKPLKLPEVLLFYLKNDNPWNEYTVTFVLRKQDFQGDFFRQFFYNTLENFYNKSMQNKNCNEYKYVCEIIEKLVKEEKDLPKSILFNFSVYEYKKYEGFAGLQLENISMELFWRNIKDFDLLKNE